jgi:undecaprenyl diphosphate synthase
MDGNGRWAAERGLPRSDGHRAGAEAVRRVVTRARERDVRYLTLYAFSAQNWKRPKNEVERLMALLSEFCSRERELLLDRDIRFRVIGDRDKIPATTLAMVQALEEVTSHGASMDLVLAVSYGGREELVRATRTIATKVAAGQLDVDSIDEETVRESLWTHDVPDPDLIIRTSGEFRLSNFLLWQLAYAEIVVDPRYWPDYDGDALDGALSEYAARERRFGRV